MKRLVTLAALAAFAAACDTGSKGGAQDSGYVTDADSGGASPNAGYTPTTPPDSNTSKSTGQPSAAGTKSNGTDIGPPQGTNPGPARP